MIEGGVIMATSSITDNIVITDPKQAEAFAAALEEAEKNPLRRSQGSVKFINSREELIQLMEKRKRLHG